MANSKEVSNDYVVTSIDDFITKVKSMGYDARLEEIIPDKDRVVISEDNYYHVSLYTSVVTNTPFNYIMKHVKKELEKLK